jgi:CheY-like chemotaxis protein
MDEFTLYNGDEVNFPRSGNLQVEVTDTGAGMTAEQVAKVFGDGVQFNVNELQVGQGSGLGLYIAKGIAVQHGGSLTVASEGLGHGTTFTLSLPLYIVPDAVLPESLKNKILLSSESVSEFKDNLSSESVSEFKDNGKELAEHPFESLRVLVVDDARVNRKLLMRLLQNQGHYCDEAEDGLVAVQLVENALKACNPYDTILMDFEMPVMNGPTAAHNIRALGCDSFIVGITGNLFPEDISFFKANGANKVLPKPLTMRDLKDLWVQFGVGTMHDRPKLHHLESVAGYVATGSGRNLVVTKGDEIDLESGLNPCMYNAAA